MTPLRKLAGIFVALILGLPLIVSSGSTPAWSFGSTELLGQNSEHEKITRTGALSERKWDPNSLSLLAGNKGNYGAVASPDRLKDSTRVPLMGLGPGYKHCDDGDYLDLPGYPQSEEAAQEELNICARYYQYLMQRAVRYAGDLVAPDSTVNPTLFHITLSSTSNYEPDNHCAWRFSLTKDTNAKCDVINALGRALHLAEDVWSHTNWADTASQNRPISISNPPGLAQRNIPEFLRFPGNPVVPEGLISGCDDSAEKSRCKNRVAHSSLAKDNGKIGETFEPTNKYSRGTITVLGTTNFERAVTGAERQVASTISDFSKQVIATYGQERGERIMKVLTSDTLESAGIDNSAVAEGPPAAAPMAIAESSEFSVDPSLDASLGEGDKTIDSGHAGHDESDKNAAQDGEETVAIQQPSPWTYLAGVAALGGGSLIALYFYRRNASKKK